MRRVQGQLAVSRAAKPTAAPAPTKRERSKPTLRDALMAPLPNNFAPLRPASTAVAFVRQFEKGLHVTPQNETLRRDNMKSSALNFYRANPGLFFNDQRMAYGGPLLGRPAPKVVIGGDTHLGNFGVIRGPAPKHEAVWALNDFDQAGIGSPEADLERLAASAVLTARDKGYSKHDQRELVKSIAAAYLTGMHQGGHGHIDSEDAHGYVQQVLDKANKQTRAQLLDGLAHDGVFRKSKDVKPLKGAEAEALKKGVEAFGVGLSNDAPVARPLQVLSIARKLNSGGSTLGLDRFYVLVAGRTGKKPRVLELKQVPPPAVEGSSPNLSKANPSAIVQRAQDLTGFKSPLYGATRVGGQPMLVREVEPEKVRVDPTKMSRADLADFADQAAQMLARSHGHKAELEQWIGKDADLLAHNLADFALRYANQIEADWHAYARG